MVKVCRICDYSFAHDFRSFLLMLKDHIFRLFSFCVAPTPAFDSNLALFLFKGRGGGGHSPCFVLDGVILKRQMLKVPGSVGDDGRVWMTQVVNDLLQVRGSPLGVTYIRSKVITKVISPRDVCELRQCLD